MSYDVYIWLKAVHIIAVIAWMAGMFYLPRLYVYHCQVAVGSAESERFKKMERLLLRAIINPALILSWAVGIALIFAPGVVDWGEGWVYAKLGFLVLLMGYHALLARWRRHFDQDQNRHSERFYRWANEVPTVLMIGIVIFAVVKPF
jgi:putative membrane protein